jgi:thioredoxin 1
MALCCINGVCVPYSALIPLLYYGLRWLLTKLTESGLIPKTWEEKINTILHKTLHPSSSSSSTKSNEASTNGSCCDATGSCSTKQTSMAETELITTITSMEQWESLFTSSSVVICKFTAKWCGPCKVIQPYYESLAKENNTIKFVTVDVDNSSTESIGSLANVAILPTFAVFKSSSTNAVSTYIGSDQNKLLNLVQSASSIPEESKKLQ